MHKNDNSINKLVTTNIATTTTTTTTLLLLLLLLLLYYYYYTTTTTTDDDYGDDDDDDYVYKLSVKWTLIRTELNTQTILHVKMPVKYLQGDRALEIPRCRRKDNIKIQPISKH